MLYKQYHNRIIEVDSIWKVRFTKFVSLYRGCRINECHIKGRTVSTFSSGIFST